MTDKDCQEILMLVTVVLESLLLTLKDTDATGKYMTNNLLIDLFGTIILVIISRLLFYR